jgi:large subunit ribosomal protein L25
MEEITLKAQVRSTGKRALKQLRKEELVPAIYYTEHREVRHVAVDALDFSHFISRKAPMLQLKLDGENLPCIIREIQRDPVTGSVLHIDFFGVERGHKLRVTIPLHIIGIPAGVKEGGILEHGFREVSIECLPRDLPAHLEIDVSELGIDDSLRIEDLSYENITLMDDPRTVIAHVARPRLEKVVAEEEAEAAAEPKEPEVITARREEEGGEEKTKEK